jgi:hypothetical protein
MTVVLASSRQGHCHIYAAHCDGALVVWLVAVLDNGEDISSTSTFKVLDVQLFSSPRVATVICTARYGGSEDKSGEGERLKGRRQNEIGAFVKRS